MKKLNYQIYDSGLDETAELRLEGLMIIKACNKEAEIFLNGLEAFRLLPPTVSWHDGEGRTYHLYEVDEAYRGPYFFELGDGIELMVGSGVQIACPIPSSFPVKSKWEWLPGKSLKERKPARLEGVSLTWFEALGHFFTYVVPDLEESEKKMSGVSDSEKQHSGAIQT